MVAIARIHRSKAHIGNGARVWDGGRCVMVVVVVVVVGDTETGKTLILCSGSGEIDRVMVL